MVKNSPETINLWWGAHHCTQSDSGGGGENSEVLEETQRKQLLALEAHAALPGPLRTILQGDRGIWAGASNNPVGLPLP